MGRSGTPRQSRLTAGDRDIYAAKGFTGELLDRVVHTTTANRQSWLVTVMDEELHLQPVQTPHIMRCAVVITIATLIGHRFLLRFAWPSRTAALITAIVLSAAAVGFLIGRLFHTAGA